MGRNHEVNAPKISQMMMGQYWLGKTKLKQAFRLTQNTFKRNLKKIIIKRNFLLTD